MTPPAAPPCRALPSRTRVLCCFWWLGPGPPGQRSGEFFCSVGVVVVQLLNSVWLCYPMDARLPCPSLSPGVCTNLYALSRLCHPTISSSVTSFSSFPQPFPESGSLPVSWLFASGGQNSGASASLTVLPKNIQGRLPLGLTGLISLLSKGFSHLPQHHSSKASMLQPSAFFMIQLSLSYMMPGKLCRG